MCSRRPPVFSRSRDHHRNTRKDHKPPSRFEHPIGSPHGEDTARRHALASHDGSRTRPRTTGILPNRWRAGKLRGNFRAFCPPNIARNTGCSSGYPCGIAKPKRARGMRRVLRTPTMDFQGPVASARNFRVGWVGRRANVDANRAEPRYFFSERHTEISNGDHRTRKNVGGFLTKAMP